MRPIAVVVALLRVFSLFSMLQFGWSLPGLFRLARYAGESAIPRFVECGLLAIIGGVVWIYSHEIGRFCVRSGSHPVEFGLRTASVLYLLLYLPEVGRYALEWVYGGFLSEGPVVRYADVVLSETHAATGLVLVGVCAALISSSHWIGSRVSYADRLRELRAEE